MAQYVFRQRLAVVGPLLLLVLLASLLRPTQAFAAPSVALNSLSGPAGTGVTVQGSGWPAGDQIVVQWQDGQQIGESISPVSGTGNFTGYFYVPQNATPGTYTVIFQDTRDTSITAHVFFSVTIPTITLQPSSGPPGTSVTAQGSGWPGGKNIELSWDGTIFLNSGYADTAGNVSIPFAVPTDATLANHQIQFMFTNGNFPVEVWKTFTVTSNSIDLEITNVQVLTQPVCVGSSPNFQADIRNNGTVESGFFDIRWNADGQLADGGHASIPAGGTGNHGHIWNNVTLGQHTLTFIADFDNLIPETNENNNQQTITFTAVDCSPGAPVANFDASPTSGNAPLIVNFHNTATGTISSCTWDYGDGTTENLCDSSHTHTYTAAGKYTVKLTVSGPGGTKTKTRSNYITVSSPPSTNYSISGNVYIDTNENGVKDAGESSYADAIVVLTGATTNSITTDPSGNYTFTGLQTGTFLITLTAPAGYHATTTDPVNIQLTANTTINFGIVPNPPPTCTQSPPPAPSPNDIFVDFRQTRDDYCFTNWSDPTLDAKVDAEWRAMIKEADPANVPIVLLEKTILSFFKQFYKEDGYCYGMAASSIIYWQHSELKPRQVATYQLSKDEGQDKIINYHALQLWDFMSRINFKITLGGDPKSEYQTLVKYLKQGKPVLLNLPQSGNAPGGHAVAAYQVHENGDIKTVSVYDSNAPGVPLKATFDTNKDTFQYVLGPYTFTEVYVTEAPISVPDNARELTRSAFKTITNWFDSNKLFQIQLHSPVMGLVTDKQGRRIGYVGQAFMNEIPNAEMFKLGEETYFYLPTSGEYTLTTTGTSQATNTSTMGVDIIIPIGNTAVKWIAYNNVPVRPASTAQVKVSVSNTDYVMQLSNDAPRNPDTVMTIRPSSVYVPLIKK